MNGSKIQQCLDCKAGEIPESSCMRSEPHRKGVCPIDDAAPRLSRENEFARELYEQIKGTAVQISAENKNYQYLRATEARATFELLGIDPDEREEFWRRLLILQDVANYRRPVKRKRRR